MNYMQMINPNYSPFPVVQDCSDYSKSIPQKRSLDPLVSFNLYKKHLDSYLENRKNKFNLNLSNNHALKTKLKLSKVSNDIGFCFQLIQEISEKTAIISNETNAMNKQEWNEYISELRSKAKELSTICLKHLTNNVCSEIHSLAQNRLEKRKCITKRKKEYTLLKKYELNKRTIQNHKIDICLNQKAKVISKSRYQVETKQRAKQILMDVENRKNEADKYILLFESIQELYSIRNKDNYKANTEFNREINNLKMLWNNTSNSYKAEKKNIKRFLHFNTTNNYEEWCDSCFLESTNDFRMCPSQKKDNGLDRLITIRNLWDACAVNNTCSINLPQFWTIPNLDPSKKWKIYIKNT